MLAILSGTHHLDGTSVVGSPMASPFLAAFIKLEANPMQLNQTDASSGNDETEHDADKNDFGMMNN